MRIKFTGYWNIPPEGAVLDDRGSVDIWLLNFIKETIEAGPETDNIYEALELSWEIEE